MNGKTGCLKGQPVLPFISGKDYAQCLQGGIAEAVDQGVKTAAGLAVGAVLIVIAGIAGQVADVVDRVNLEAGGFRHGAVKGCNARYHAAVVANGLNGAIGGKAGGDAGHQDQNVLVPDQRLGIVPENDLAVGVVLRFQHTDFAVIVDAAGAGNQLPGQAGADDGSAVEAENSANRPKKSAML